jgi:cardiolipin synthase A/B
VTSPSPNRFRLLVGGDAFCRAVAEDLGAAPGRVCVQFSTFEGDRAGQAFGDLLLARASAGGDVRMILDRYSEVIVSDTYPVALHRRRAVAEERRATRHLLERLAGVGVAIQQVAPPGRFRQYLLYRDHKKMVVLDDEIAYVGGINVSDHNFAWHDFMVRIEGPLAADVGRDFMTTWAGSTAPLTEARPLGDYVLNQCAGRPTILDEVIRLVGDARDHLVIESPYLCGDRIEAALLDAASRGVRVLVIVPSRPNHLHNRVWSPTVRRRLTHRNITVRGFSGTDGMTHAKLLVVDDRIAVLGSLNYQEIEALTQKELNVFVREPSIVAELRAFAESDAAGGIALSPPRWAPGRTTYHVAHALLERWTRRLARRPAWRARYC